MATASNPIVLEVREVENGQAVMLPPEFHLSSSQVYVRRHHDTGVMEFSERPFTLSLQELFAKVDEAMAAGETFELDRDVSLPVERDLF